MGPGEEGWRTLGVAEPLPAPCPAHEDPGLLTVIYDDRSALQARLQDGRWVDVPLATDECALIAGRALEALTRASVPACTHRVRAVAPSRTSLVFERLPDEAGLRRRAAAESARAARASNLSTDAKYARAAGALLSANYSANGAPLLLLRLSWCRRCSDNSASAIIFRASTCCFTLLYTHGSVPAAPWISCTGWSHYASATHCMDARQQFRCFYCWTDLQEGDARMHDVSPSW